MSEFMELEPCPDCECPVKVVFDADTVRLECTGCGRSYGVGAPAREARTLCVYWDLLLRREPEE